MARMTKEQKAEKLLDKKVEAVYYKTCSGIQINIMDIPKVFKYGRQLIAEGKSLEEELPKFVRSIAAGESKAPFTVQVV
jgi:hypothetical protein